MGIDSADQELRIRQILEQDRGWSAYALADLTPGFVEDTAWYLNGSSLIMTYSGIQPAVLFTMGKPAEVEELLQSVPLAAYQYAVPADHLVMLRQLMEITSTLTMHRMVLEANLFPTRESFKADLLSSADIDDITTLFSDHPDQPDAFTPSQLDQGTFYGIREDGNLVSFAGTHVVSNTYSAAAVGNVFTHPAWRGRGLATRTTGAVIKQLLQRQIQTIVLNVSAENPAAIHAYEKLGFVTACSFYEGTGTIA